MKNVGLLFYQSGVNLAFIFIFAEEQRASIIMNNFCKQHFLSNLSSNIALLTITSIWVETLTMFMYAHTH